MDNRSILGLYLRVAAAAAAGGFVGGALVGVALGFGPLGGAIYATIPSVLTWLLLFNIMRPPDWVTTIGVGLFSPFVGMFFGLCLPLGPMVYAWYVTFPTGIAMAIVMRQVILRYDPESRDRFSCPCGYNLTGNTSGICPECGAPTRSLNSDP